MRFLVHRPWFRLPSYLIGMFLGMIISRIHSARFLIKLSPVKSFTLFYFGVVLCFIAIFSLNFDFYNFRFEIQKRFDQDESFTNT